MFRFLKRMKREYQHQRTLQHIDNLFADITVNMKSNLKTMGDDMLERQRLEREQNTNK